MANFLSYLWEQLVPTIVAVVSFVASVITIIQTIKSKTKLSRILLIISIVIFIMSAIYLAYMYTPPHDSNSSSIGGIISASDAPAADTNSESPQQPTVSPDYSNQTPTNSSDNNSTATRVESPSANTKAEGATTTGKGIGTTNADSNSSTAAIYNDASSSSVGGDSYTNNGGTMQIVEGTNNTIDNEDTKTTVTNGDNGTSVINNGHNNINIFGGNNTIGGTEPSEPVVTVTEVELDKKTADLYIDQQFQLTATVFYSNNESVKNGSEIKWESSNDSVAEVDQDGYVRLKAPGTTKIIAQASKNNSAQSDTCIVTVKERISPPSGYSISLSSAKTTIGSQFVIYITPYEDNYTQILVHAESPSGAIDTYPWAEGKRYYIDTETGTWKISATIVNEAGRYEAHIPEDYAIIEIAPISFDPYIPDNILP